MTQEPEPLAVLLLPRRLEDFELAAHARDLLTIPRVVAVEPPHARTRRLRRNTVTALQARRLRFPGEPRAFVLYHPGQYPLARALLGVHGQAELWYVQPDRALLRADPEVGEEELIELDELAQARAGHLLAATLNGDARVENEPLRSRLWELGVITHRPFLPGLRRASDRVPNRLRPI
jgi:hypothetical protein